MTTYLIGIDEVGRGPLAGPVAVGAVIYRHPVSVKLKKFFNGTRDSKKLSREKREEIFQKIKIAEEEGSLEYAVCFASSKVIDSKGISFAIQSCITKCLKKVAADPKYSKVLLDGGLRAPAEFTNQETIIRGDDKELVISLASIAAKVTRDRHMQKLSKKYPAYDFHIHKGYGTQKHRRIISQHGPCAEHRMTFLKNLQKLQK